MVKIGDRVQIDEAVSNYYGRCGIVTGDDSCGPYPYRVKFEDGDDCIFNGKDLKVLHEEETTMEFKVGDKVKILNTEFGNQGRVGTITTISGTTMIYLVEIVGAFGKDCQWSNTSDLELVTEEEKEMKFKVGDKVRMIRNTYGHRGKIGTLEKIDDSTMPYCVVFDDGRKEWCYGHEFKLLKEEKVMEFKVGDKVKVKDSWFGLTGEVGLIVRIDGPVKYPYRVKFDVVDEEDEELFAEGSLELVKEKAKQQFTKSDLKTGMGVVLRDGTKGHVLLDTVAGDVIRFINEGSNQWGSVDEYDENMIDCDMGAMDIVEVYSSKYAYCYLTDRVFNQDCVFKREEPKPEPKSEPKSEPEPTKMTMKEINEHFGKPIEIVE